MRATKVNAGLAESNGKLLLGICRDSLHVTCGLTACTPGSAPGPTLGNEYGKTLPWFVYTGKNPRFTAFLGSNLHTRLAILTENELGLTFLPRNLPKKFRPDPSTFYLVIVVTNKQTDRQTDKPTPVIT